jgi:hypothetical protein
VTAAMFAEFRDGQALVRAIEALRARGYQRLSAYSPYAVHGIETALGTGRSRLPFLVFAAAMLGGAGGYFLQWLLNAYLYPLDVGGRPAHMPVAFVPITFEMAVLAGALTAVASVVIGGRLLRLWDPVFEVDGFESASKDGYWLRLDLDDAEASHERASADLAATDPLRIVTQEVTP